MAVEIERKFLLKNEDWRHEVDRSVPMRQGYLGGDKSSVRVRTSGQDAWLNIKSLDMGRARLEFEYKIPIEEADELLDQLASGPCVDKIRHYVARDGLLWEIDEFQGANGGLIVAEVELTRVDQVIPQPDWLGTEVTDQERYYNVRLARHPYSDWEDKA